MKETNKQKTITRITPFEFVLLQVALTNSKIVLTVLITGEI